MNARAPDARAYVARVLLPSLGLEGRPFTSEPPAPGGTASRASKVIIEGAPTVLLRLFEDRGRALRSAAALRHLEDLGLPAPRLVHADTGLLNRLRRRFPLPCYATAETWIEGIRAVDTPDERGTALGIAALLARFHAFTRPRWGRPDRLPDPRSYAPAVLALAQSMIRRLRVRGILSPEEAVETSSRFAAWRTRLEEIGTFHLVLNDANRRNFILAPDGGIVAIDVQRISYEPCSEEIANALYHFCRHDDRLASLFVAAYLERASLSSRETWGRTAPFFTALNTLKRIHRRTGPEAEAAGGETLVRPGEPRLAAWRDRILTLPAPGAAASPDQLT